MSKLVIIDDEPQIAAMLEKWFNKSEMFNVHVFNDPIVAVSQIVDINPDVILLDIMMPQMDGIEALVKIKERLPNVKIIMMTAYSTLDKVFNSQKGGADSYILKPFDSLAAVEQKVLEILK